MLKADIPSILTEAEKWGWVLEPEAKRVLSLWGLPVPRFKWSADLNEAREFARLIGYPVVAKVVSPKILHKSEVKGVAVDVQDDVELGRVFERFRALPGFAGMLVEAMHTGLELIAGAKVDYQFGPVILLGIGGTGVEIYKDSTLRMAPLGEKDVETMLAGLKGHPLLEGYRGRDPIDLEALTRFLVSFSELVMSIEERITSIDINPLLCSKKGCIAADARILLASFSKP